MFDTAVPTAGLRPVHAPFEFHSASHLTRIAREQATTLGELLENLKTCSDDSIFYHTFQTLNEHHFIREGFSNDFAHWAFAACNEVGLAERLSAVDIRDFTTLLSLREHLVRLVEAYLQYKPAAATRVAFEPFYFCASETVEVPTPYVAHDLKEFIECMRLVSLQCIHHHLIAARLRLHLVSNDFSIWLKEELGLTWAAARLERLDLYTLTLHDIRREILRILQSESQGSRS